MKKTAGEHVVLWVSVGLMTAWTLVPIAVMAWVSLMPLNALIDRGLLQWPRGMSFANYRAILGIRQHQRGLRWAGGAGRTRLLQ
jgi:ABC-type glycerol-3-phosphate transport system permease component